MLRIATYNVHKCQGMDGRTRPSRTAKVMLRLDADAIALQEILADQAEELARALRPAGYTLHFAENRKIGGVAYGNATFTRLPVELTRNYDLTCAGREPRSALRTDLSSESGTVYLFNVHLGTSYSERREQAATLLAERILLNPALPNRRIICGDFNDWSSGPCTRAMARQFQHTRHKSFPAILPVLPLDRIYFNRSIVLERSIAFRQRPALIASDHLPIVAELRV